ncbi:hypothetical protein [Virgisporangium aliadipatigenens]|nr:hypothetical protein [Virgisporangium aliadipatigenens]
MGRRNWALPTAALAFTLLAVANPTDLARVHRATAVVAGGAVTLGLATAAALADRRHSLSRRIKVVGAVGFVVAALLGTFGVAGVQRFAPHWEVLATSPDGRYAVARYAEYSLGADSTHVLHLWAGSGVLARDMGHLVSYSDEYRAVALGAVEFAGNRTVRARIGDADYLFDVAPDGHPTRRAVAHIPVSASAGGR